MGLSRRGPCRRGIRSIFSATDSRRTWCRRAVSRCDYRNSSCRCRRTVRNRHRPGRCIRRCNHSRSDHSYRNCCSRHRRNRSRRSGRSIGRSDCTGRSSAADRCAIRSNRLRCRSRNCRRRRARCTSGRRPGTSRCNSRPTYSRYRNRRTAHSNCYNHNSVHNRNRPRRSRRSRNRRSARHSTRPGATAHRQVRFAAAIVGSPGEVAAIDAVTAATARRFAATAASTARLATTVCLTAAARVAAAIWPKAIARLAAIATIPVAAAAGLGADAQHSAEIESVARRSKRDGQQQQHGLQAELHISPLGTTARWTATADSGRMSRQRGFREMAPLGATHQVRVVSGQNGLGIIDSASPGDKKNRYNRRGLPTSDWRSLVAACNAQALLDSLAMARGAGEGRALAATAVRSSVSCRRCNSNRLVHTCRTNRQRLLRRSQQANGSFAAAKDQRRARRRTAIAGEPGGHDFSLPTMTELRRLTDRGSSAVR